MKCAVLVCVLFVSIVVAEQSPCSDSTYLAIKSMPIDSISEREYQYLQEMNRLCYNSSSNDQKVRIEVDDKNNSYEEWEKKTNKEVGVALGVGVVALAIVGGLLAWLFSSI